MAFKLIAVALTVALAVSCTAGALSGFFCANRPGLQRLCITPVQNLTYACCSVTLLL